MINDIASWRLLKRYACREYTLSYLKTSSPQTVTYFTTFEKNEAYRYVWTPSEDQTIVLVSGELRLNSIHGTVLDKGTRRLKTIDIPKHTKITIGKNETVFLNWNKGCVFLIFGKQDYQDFIDVPAGTPFIEAADLVTRLFKVTLAESPCMMTKKSKIFK